MASYELSRFYFRNRWVEFVPRFGLSFRLYHFPNHARPGLNICLIWGNLFLTLPWVWGYDRKAKSLLDGRAFATGHATIEEAQKAAWAAWDARDAWDRTLLRFLLEYAENEE